MVAELEVNIINFYIRKCKWSGLEFLEKFFKPGVWIRVHNVFFFKPAPPSLPEAVPYGCKVGNSMAVRRDTELQAEILCSQDKLVVEVKPRRLAVDFHHFSVCSRSFKDLFKVDGIRLLFSQAACLMDEREYQDTCFSEQKRFFLSSFFQELKSLSVQLPPQHRVL